VFEESALLQAVLADITPPSIRDVTSSAYFTLMFVVGAIWAAALGGIVGALGDQQGFVVVFSLMAVSYLLAAVVILPVRADGDQPDRSGRVDRSGPVGLVETVPVVEDPTQPR
jgi:MFS family permease